MFYKMIFFNFFIFLLYGCETRNKCNEPFSKPIDSLVRVRNIDKEYKEFQLETSERLMGKFCSLIYDKKSILLIDVPKVFKGLVYVYDNCQVYTYDHFNDTFKIANDFRYDSSGGLKRYFLSIKDSTLEKLKKQDEEKTSRLDSRIVHVFYLDNEKKVFKLFNLY